MASWNDLFRFNHGVENPQWMGMNVGTAAAQVFRYPTRENAGQHFSLYSCGCDSGYYAPCHHSGYHPPCHKHHSGYKAERVLEQKSNHHFWWTPPPTAYDPPNCTMVLNVPICCDGREERARSRLMNIEGVRAVDVDRSRNEMTVSGTFAPNEILNACKQIFKKSKWQPTVPT